MADFTVVIMRPECVGQTDRPELACVSVIVEADDAASAANAGAASVILAFRRAGEVVRLEELCAVTVYAGRHVNLLSEG